MTFMVGQSWAEQELLAHSIGPQTQSLLCSLVVVVVVVGEEPIDEGQTTGLLLLPCVSERFTRFLSNVRSAPSSSWPSSSSSSVLEEEASKKKEPTTIISS